MKPMIDIENLQFRYGKGDFRLRVGRLGVARGATVAFVGPSGSGKTTLLNLVAGIVPPIGGRVETDGVEVGRLAERERRRFRVTRIGLVFQEFELLEYLTVIDNILLPYRINPALRLDGDVRRRAAELAQRVGIADKLARHPRNLSQGERQRVAVCRAVLPRPPLLLADEPTGNLDPANKDRVLQILFEYAAETRSTMLAVTHDHDVLDRFDRIIDFKEFQEG
jgi:putative ABC transport system ATP-binding protein